MVELIPNPEFERIALPALTSYRNAVPGAFVPPPLADIRTRAHRRAVVRKAGLAAAAAGVVAAISVGVAVFPGRHHTTPPPGDRPAPTPPASTATASPSAASPTPSPTASTALAEPLPKTWAGKTVVLPAATGYAPCPQGRVTFAPEGDTLVDNTVIRISQTRATGDLTDDGQPEAVIYVSCRGADSLSADGSGHLMVITRDPTGTFAGLAHVGPDGEEYPEVEVRDGALVATIHQRYNPQVVQQRIYRWDGRSFKQVAGPTAFPPN